jgi:hypothetical protein
MAGALVLNIGTLSAAWIEAMVKAAGAARKRSIPVVLDPVGAGATRFRTETAERLLKEAEPAIVRGNASEIRALAGAGESSRGVDSTHMRDQAPWIAARSLSERCRCVVVVSGADGLDRCRRQPRLHPNGHPMDAPRDWSRLHGDGTGGRLRGGESVGEGGGRHAMAVHGHRGRDGGRTRCGRRAVSKCAFSTRCTSCRKPTSSAACAPRNHEAAADWRLYLVTDRHIAGARPIEDLVVRRRARGVTAVQLREKECGTREFVELGRRLKKLLEPFAVP